MIVLLHSVMAFLIIKVMPVGDTGHSGGRINDSGIKHSVSSLNTWSRTDVAQ